MVSCHEFMYPPDPHGVKKWGGYDPPSSYGCAAHVQTPDTQLTEKDDDGNIKLCLRHDVTATYYFTYNCCTISLSLSMIYH